MNTIYPFEFTIGNTIEFKNFTETNPIIPLVQANYSDSSKRSISVSVNVFINADVKIDKENITITQDDQNKYIYFVEYIKDNKSNSAKLFKNYRIDFIIHDVNADNNHGEIIVYLKDEDPTLSRGTVTTVQHNN